MAEILGLLDELEAQILDAKRLPFSNKALVVVVVPWINNDNSRQSAPATVSAAMTPTAWLFGVDGTLEMLTSPAASSSIIRSVKVPPTSQPITLLMCAVLHSTGPQCLQPLQWPPDPPM